MVGEMVDEKPGGGGGVEEGMDSIMEVIIEVALEVVLEGKIIEADKEGDE